MSRLVSIVLDGQKDMSAEIYSVVKSLNKIPYSETIPSMYMSKVLIEGLCLYLVNGSKNKGKVGVVSEFLDIVFGCMTDHQIIALSMASVSGLEALGSGLDLESSAQMPNMMKFCLDLGFSIERGWKGCHVGYYDFPSSSEQLYERLSAWSKMEKRLQDTSLHTIFGTLNITQYKTPLAIGGTLEDKINSLCGEHSRISGEKETKSWKYVSYFVVMATLSSIVKSIRDANKLVPRVLAELSSEIENVITALNLYMNVGMDDKCFYFSGDYITIDVENFDIGKNKFLEYYD